MTGPNILTDEVVLLRGSSLLRADTLQEIATLGTDGQWRSPEGIVTDAIAVPRHTPHAVISPKAAAAAHREQDQAWITDAMRSVAALARAKRDLTVDDCWIALTMPPRRPSLMSSLMVAAQQHGLIEKTAEHRRSVRPTNGGRTVRVWRSRIPASTPTTPERVERGLPTRRTPRRTRGGRRTNAPPSPSQEGMPMPISQFTIDHAATARAVRPYVCESRDGEPVPLSALVDLCQLYETISVPEDVCIYSEQSRSSGVQRLRVVLSNHADRERVGVTRSFHLQEIISGPESAESIALAIGRIVAHTNELLPALRALKLGTERIEASSSSSAPFAGDLRYAMQGGAYESRSRD